MKNLVNLGVSEELEIVNEYAPDIMFELSTKLRQGLSTSALIQHLRRDLLKAKVPQDIISILLKAVEAAASKTNQYFSKTDEFQCPCCGAALFDKTFLRMLGAARTFAQIEFSIYDGYHCEAYYQLMHASENAEDDFPGSMSHFKGKGADILAGDPAIRYEVLYGLLGAGFTRIGLATDYVHADSDTGPNTPRNVIWLDGEIITDNCHQRFLILKKLILDVGVNNLEINGHSIRVLPQIDIKGVISLTI